MSKQRTKSRKKRSYVWKYFDEPTNETKSNGRVVLCTVEGCTDKIETTDYSTASMISHLKLKHGIFVISFSILILQGITDEEPEKQAKSMLSKEKQEIADLSLYVNLIINNIQ